MKNIIKELAQKAKLPLIHDEFMTSSQEKFAELIVRECARLVEENIDPQNAWITPGFIKEHFGIKK